MTRLTDVDIAIEKIKQLPITYDAETIQRCIEILSNSPTIDAEPHWIPCSERLPEDGVYLVYAPEYRGGSSRSKECHEGLLFSVCKNGKWSIEHGYYSRPNCVIAWMPLPKPFKVYKMR